ncbi:MAG TPA: pitrilysin family protein [Longimicrobiaceae bacterium]|nr:pitrilysin family protein [Longimicrobiaceae bacterium]
MRASYLPTTLLASALALAAAPAAAQDREQPPAAGPLRPYVVPQVHDFRLANGVRVVVVPQPTLPIVSGRIILNAGAVYEPAEKNGLAALTGNLLDEGAQGITGPELAQRMEQLGAQFSTGAGQATAFASVSAVKGVFPDALELAARTVRAPTFPEAEFTRVRNESVAAHVQALASVEGLSSEAFWRAVFESSAPYARRSQGTRESLPRITRDDVLAWHRRMFAPGNATLLLVGAVTVDEARQWAERALGAWSGQAPQLSPVANPARAVQGTRVILVDRPGSVQSGVWVGQASLGAADPNFVPMQALSQVLGGGFKARINMNLRERHGWTYGAFTAFAPLDRAGVFAISSSVRTNATDSALVEMVGEYRRIAAEEVPAEELRNAVGNIVGSFPSSVQTVQSLAGRVEQILIYGLPLDYLATYRERLAGVTPQAVAALARAHLRPDALTIVVAGDLAAIEAPIRALNLGTVEVWDAAGNQVR